MYRITFGECTGEELESSGLTENSGTEKALLNSQVHTVGVRTCF